jgi:hypothetical protein
VFSIDPPTARDLDDALHIMPVPGKPGHWHVGVHIADVARFIPPFSALDYEVCVRLVDGDGHCRAASPGPRRQWQDRVRIWGNQALN